MWYKVYRARTLECLPALSETIFNSWLLGCITLLGSYSDIKDRSLEHFPISQVGLPYDKIHTFRIAIKQLPFLSFSRTLSFRFIFCFTVHFHYIRLYIFFIILCSFIIFSGCFTRGDSEEVLYPFLPFRCGLRTEWQSWWGPFLFTCQRK